jgi:hypothetical protein
LHEIWNVPLLATEVPGFPQDIHDGHAVELIEKELEQTTALGEPQDDTVVERPERTAGALREGLQCKMT